MSIIDWEVRTATIKMLAEGMHDSDSLFYDKPESAFNSVMTMLVVEAELLRKEGI